MAGIVAPAACIADEAIDVGRGLTARLGFMNP